MTKTPKPTLCHPYSLPLSLLTSKLSQNPPFSNSFYYFLSFPSPFFYFLSHPTTLIPATAPSHHATCTLTQARPKNTTFTALDSTLDNLGTMDFRLVSVCVWSGVDFVPLCTSNSSSEGDGGGKKRREEERSKRGERERDGVDVVTSSTRIGISEGYTSTPRKPPCTIYPPHPRVAERRKRKYHRG